MIGDTLAAAVLVGLIATLAFAASSSLGHAIRRHRTAGPHRTQYRGIGRWRRVRYVCTTCGMRTVWWYVRGVLNTGHTIEDWGGFWYRLACKCHRATA